MSKQLRIGVFVSDKGQMLDVATVDVLGSMSKEYLCMIPFASKSLVDSAPSVSIFYIATPSLRAGVPLTSGMTIKPTHVYSDPEVAPGKLDIIVVPGTDPVVTHEEGGLRWLREHFETPGVDVLSVCTGLFICAQAGIADGRRASGPREMQDWLRQAHPKIKLAGEELRWVQDGNLWSSGKFFFTDIPSQMQ